MDLWLIKLHAPLTTLCATATSLASGKVKPQAVAGLEALWGLCQVQWASQAADWRLFPSTEQLHLLDRRFGGKEWSLWQLVFADVLAH